MENKTENKTSKTRDKSNNQRYILSFFQDSSDAPDVVIINESQHQLFEWLYDHAIFDSFDGTWSCNEHNDNIIKDIS